MLVKKHHVTGYESFLNFVKNYESNDSLFILYIGTKLPDGSGSWCPDCVDVKPFVKDWFVRVVRPVQWLIVQVGDKAAWKDMNCPFRTSPLTKLTVLPTLAKWKSQERLEGKKQCTTMYLLEMFLTEGDEEYHNDAESGMWVKCYY